SDLGPFSLAPFSVSSPVFIPDDPAPTATYTLSLHDALPISFGGSRRGVFALAPACFGKILDPCGRVGIADPRRGRQAFPDRGARSEEHTSELQSRENLVCRLLLEKKKKKKKRQKDR